MKILIVGGGVAGPTLAKFLKGKADVTLVDKAPMWGNIGYAISLWSNGQKILQDLNIDNSVLKMSYQLPWSLIEDKKGKPLQLFAMDIFNSFGPTMVVTRTDLQSALVKDIENVAKVKMGTTVVKMFQTKNNVQVTFSDGTEDEFDLVVGADGVRSQIRDLVFGQGFVKYYGWNIYVFWTPAGIAIPKGIVQFGDDGKLCFTCPVGDRAVTMLGIASRNKVVKETVVSKEFLHETFIDFKDVVGHLIDAIEDPAHIFRDDLTYVTMKDWYKGRVALMGDAKHAQSPVMGMGSSMALEDAYVLADELKRVDAAHIPEALKKYALRRDKRIKRFHKISNSVESWLLVKSRTASFFRDLIIRFIPTSFFTNKIKKILAEQI